MVVSLVLASNAGCESDAQTGALIGSAAGAGIGQLAGRDTESTLIGAGVGGTAGYMIGNESDKKKAAAERESLRSSANNTVTIWVTCSNGKQIPVTLTKKGTGYVGPKGEVYNTLPSEEDLRQLYGF